MYRNESLAQITQIDELRGDLAAMHAAVEASERARADALAELERLRDGVELDPEIEHDRGYRWLVRGLRAFVACAAVGLVLALVPLLCRIVAEPMLTAQGLSNLAFHLQHGRGLIGLAATGFVLVCASPWIVVPWFAVRGLARHRRAGWTLGVAACAMFLVTPLLPLAVVGLQLLYSSRVRRMYLAR
jgi:hypothetical protein